MLDRRDVVEHLTDVAADAVVLYSGPRPVFDTHLAAMEHLIHESESLGIKAELPEFVKTLTDRAVAAGHGGDSYAAMIEQFRKPPAGRP